ncbi:MAG: serine/threonine protein kinase [Chloroflexota bacterium]|nr:serine/threonine protein kinase [Chloroflexota bacterium]
MRYTPENPGEIIHDYYVVEELLGQGGFSAVYLVRDIHMSAPNNLFALKELIDNDKQDKERFAFECEVLKRLNHPSLPCVREVFQDENRAYLVMDYVKGPNLETLRKHQPDERFSLPEVLTIMAPIMDAVSYLHNQYNPIIHRDIKPANIIVPTAGDKAVLVDFGIAKEYHPDSTTTAVRHCSPGYGAPEQYSIGTDTRTDIYGLGATCYALLTGIVPVDSLLRATQMAGKGNDPLVPMNELVPDLPEGAIAAIQRAMSLNRDWRFSTVEDFRKALSDQVPPTPAFADFRSESSPHPGQVTKDAAFALPKRALSTRLRGFALTSLAIMLVVLAGLSFAAYMKNNSGSASLHKVVTTTNGSTPKTATSAPTTPSKLYPNLSAYYHGKIQNLQSNQQTPLFLMQVQQQNETIQGTFIGLNVKGTFTGVVDTTKHIYITVAGYSGNTDLYLYGVVRPDGNLVGDYYTVNSTGQRVGDTYGIWTTSPMG